MSTGSAGGTGVDNAKLFDHYAPDYEATVNSVISASGESVEYFARLKAELAAHELRGRKVETLLDFGCGTGNSTAALAEAFPGTRIRGSDISPDSVGKASAEHGTEDGRVAFVANEGERLPFPDASFDAAFTACVFHHIERPEHADWLREIRRVLRPGGVLLIFEHNPYNPLTRRVVRDCPFDEGVTLLGPRYTRAILGRAGFVPTRPRYYFFFPSLLARLRPGERLLRWLPLGGQYYVAAERPR